MLSLWFSETKIKDVIGGKTTMKTRKHLIFWAVVAAIALAVIYASPVFAEPAESRFIASFIDDVGSPYPMDMYISDGISVQTYLNVTTLDVIVPPKATYTYEYSTGENTVMSRVNLEIPEGESREYIFHALGASGTIDDRIRPYVAMEEVGANPELSWSYNSDLNQLTWNITHTEGKIVGVTIQIDGDLTSGDNYALTQCAANGQGWGIDFFSIRWSFASPVPAFDQITGFGKIEPGTVLVGFRDMTKNGFTLRPTDDIVFDSVCTCLQGAQYPPKYLYPQYGLTAGRYLIRPTDLPVGCVELTLPLNVKQGRPEVLELYPANPSIVSPYSFYVLAENYFTKTAITDIEHTPDNRIIASLLSIGNGDRWGYFVVPDSFNIDGVIAVLADGEQKDLTLLEDYTITESNGLKFVTVRTDYLTNTVILIPVPAISHCFIATAAYGTPMAPQIQVLRDFKDQYLMTNPMGEALVELYYKASPPIAEFIDDHPALKPIVRAGLVPAVAMSTVAVNTTPAEKAAIIGLLALVSVALAVWATRRRRRGPEYT